MGVDPHSAVGVQPTTAEPAPVATAAPGRALAVGPAVVPSRGYYRRAWDKLRHDPVSIAAAVGLGIIVLITILAPFIAQNVLHRTPEEIMRTPDGRIAVLQPPGPEYQ